MKLAAPKVRFAVSFLLLITFFSSSIINVPIVHAAAAAATVPTASDLDAMMAKLGSTDISYAEKKRLAAIIFVHQDVYRKAVILGQYPAKSTNVDNFLDYKSKLQMDVAERMNVHYRNETGANIKEPIIPFAYNNILSDDDVITGAGKGGKKLEGLYVDSLDELIRERAGQAMTEADRHRVDVNGLAWDMTQKGALENYWHKEKYINPQSGFANQQKLIGAGDAVKVMGFDENGKIVLLQGEEKKKAILSLTVDEPLRIDDDMMAKGTGSMSDYARMADIHQVKFKGTLTPEEIATFIRNQKYTDRVVADFNDIAAKDNPDLKRDLQDFIDTSNQIRKQTTARGVAEILEKQYGIKLIGADGAIDFDKMRDVMKTHQAKQLEVAMPKMIGAVSANEAVKISGWLKSNPGMRSQLRKQLALTYAPFNESRMTTIMEDLEKLDIPAEDKEFLKSVLTKDAQQIRDYAKMMNLSTDDLVKHLGIEGDNMRAVELMESLDGNIRTLEQDMLRRPGGGAFNEFLKSKTAKALNLDIMLEGTKGQKVMFFSVMLLAMGRAYGAAERNDEGIKKAGMAAFEMIPFVSSVLRFSEGEFKESFKQLAMDIFPPLALADIAFTVLHFTGNIAKNAFTETVWEGLVNEALKELTDDDFEKTELKYYRLKNRESYFEFIQEVEAGFGRVQKLSAMIEPQVDVMMAQNSEAKINDAALYTCQYFEEFDVIGIRKSLTENYKIEQIKSRFWAEGGPDSLKSSAATPVQRRAAWLIMENLKIRAELHKMAIQGFIDRIEYEYNKRKKEDENTDPNGILENTRLILKGMFEGAPAVIQKSEWAAPKLQDEYRRLLNFLKNYKAEGKDIVVLKQEMQSVIDGFQKFIADLERAVALAAEKDSLSLNAVVFGGEKSTVSTKEVLLADTFRLGITAHVQSTRANVPWNVFYYLIGGADGIKLLGQKSLSSGQAQGGGEGMFVIDESSKATHLQIEKGKLKPDFEKEGEYIIYPVIAFGGWTDPIRQVGYEALNNPSEYPELFTPERVAFSGGAANLTIRKAKILIKVPPVVYKNDKAKALMNLDVPEYMRQETAEGEMRFSGPANALKLKLDPEKRVDPLSMNEEKPTEVAIQVEENADEGTYYIELKAKLRNFPDEAQPLPFTKNFDFVNQNNPLLGDDLTKLHEQMKALDAQANAIYSALKSDTDEYMKRLSEAIGSLADAKKLAADDKLAAEEIEKKAGPLLSNIEKIKQDQKDADAAGKAVADLHSGAEQNVLKTCETAKAMSGVKDIKQLETFVNQAHQADADFQSKKSAYDTEIEKAKTAATDAETLNKSTTEAIADIKKEKIDTNPLNEVITKAQGIADEGEGKAKSSDADQEKLKGIKDTSATLMGQADSILKAIIDPAKKTDNEKLFREMQGFNGRIEIFYSNTFNYAGPIRANSSKLKDDLAAAEKEFSEVTDKVQVLKYMVPEDTAMTEAQTAAADAKAAYEAASIYGEQMTELGSNCSTCLNEVEKILSNAQKDSGGSVKDKDCSAQPGTVARIRENGEVYCGCLDNKNWDAAQNKCIGAAAQNENKPVDPATAVAQANCSVYPNSTPQWNYKFNRVDCLCNQGYQWNGSSCLASPQTQVAQANCSMYPNTTAQWNTATNQVQCACNSGYQWNGSACIDQQTAVAQTNCSMYPNTTAQWDGTANGVRCNCNSGYTWNGSMCVANQQTQAASNDCSMYPNSTAQWNASINGMQCVCNTGFVWNGSACAPNLAQAVGGNQNGQVNQSACAAYPNTTAALTAAGQIQCNCNSGYVWDGSKCMATAAAGDDVNCTLFPNSTKTYDPSIGGNRCVCNQGYTWNGNGCAANSGQTSSGGQGGSLDCSSHPNTHASINSIGEPFCECNPGTNWSSEKGCTLPDLISPIANAAGSGLGANPLGNLPNIPAKQCPPGQVDMGGFCGLAPAGSTNQNKPDSSGRCPNGSIALLGVCSGS